MNVTDDRLGRVQPRDRGAMSLHHHVPAHVWAEEPDPLDTLGAAEDKKEELRDLAHLPGMVLRDLEMNGLVGGFKLLASVATPDGKVPGREARPPRWECHRLAVQMELRRRGGFYDMKECEACGERAPYCPIKDECQRCGA